MKLSAAAERLRLLASLAPALLIGVKPNCLLGLISAKLAKLDPQTETTKEVELMKAVAEF